MSQTTTSTHADERLLGDPAGSGRRAQRVSPGSVFDTRGPWPARLRRALAEELFVLHFQPIVALRDNRVSHFEALLRLADAPDGRLMAPSGFLPAAERCGLIREIDRMVIDRAAALLGGGRGCGGVDDLDGGERRAGIAVNVSGVSVSDGELLAHLHRSLAEHEADPSLLVLELTETAAIHDMARAKAFCAGVQALGCKVALDDFGAGFGSFRYLKHLPFSYLKIDGEFIRGLATSRIDQLVVGALVGVARGLGRETIAEFVGDEPTLAALRTFGVDYAQGFALGRPSAEMVLAA